ncbi:MAG: helix-turn-helix domain-containing protein [Sphingomonadaceae bacterium]
MSLLKLKEASERLRLSRATLYRLEARGLLPIVRIGRAARIRAEDVEKLIERLAQEAA